jgi:Predicted transcriptional regulators
MNFSEKLQELRKNNGLSQEELAEKCNVSRQAVSKWESGQGYPELEKLIKLCDLFEVNLDYLVRGKELENNTVNEFKNDSSYSSFLGKYAKILLDDREFQGLYQVFIIGVNDNYIVFEENSKTGVLKTQDIKVISEANISSKKSLKVPQIIITELSYNINPYEQFIGKTCKIRLKCTRFLSYPQGFYSCEIQSVTNENITIAQKGSLVMVKISDVLMIKEF